jgi:bifunctional DNA-binding transcriptional regulator/antitoxin component of YhaV-PrlF toxin-antitoxin module
MREVLYTTMNNEGRLVVPAIYRKQFGLKFGEKVIWKPTQEGLLITTFDMALKGFQDDVASLMGGGASLVQELLVERQEEASKEASG